MTLLYRNLSVALEDAAGDLTPLVARKLRVAPEKVVVRDIVRRSIDARKGRPPRYLFTVAVELPAEIEATLLRKSLPNIERFERAPVVSVPSVPAADSGRRRPVIIGAGPAGLFAAYRLAQAGVPGIVVERGLPVLERSIQWNGFLKGKQTFDPESNLLFGEGGAGTYSDGKLYTRVHDERAPEVLRVLAECGAPDEILYEGKPHVGSNLLPSIIRRLREWLIAHGIEFRFSTRMTGIELDGRELRAIRVRARADGEGSGDSESGIECDTLFLGLGHSARDTLRMLHASGIRMERKPFQIGARVEHPQRVVDAMQYGESAGHPQLPPADYRLVAKRRTGDVFSFCMCPGGEILPATEKAGFICVNGASRFKRIGDFANSGFVMTLEPEEFGRAASDVLAGLALQEQIESKAARIATHPFGAPALRLVDFLEGRTSIDLPPTSYPLPLTSAPFAEFLPGQLLASLREGLDDLCRRIPLFRDPEAIIVGPESRSSSPVRIVRDAETLESPSARGLYPMGEGAGFAGGILSAAIDGMHCAERYLARITAGGGAQ
ncbi:MAG: FAD-dependent oxidoreductase [Planctomycetes bacterium]|nr:FAD-dependent oxidoreductase [Planctomycetota bacterium]